jgi:filamentous hemagglutinin family protein
MGSALWVLDCFQPITAQVIPDDTLPVGERSLVTGNPNFQIDGGATRGSNLFHSFSQFSIPTGGSAFFNNAADVQNILTRVTGGSISNIDGLIRANGTANLFLLNPNGIIFGQNASLNIGGSFVATTANAFGFGNVGFFSASNPEVPSSLLTINPSALLFNQIAAAPIQNRSTAPAGTTLTGDDALGLRVPNGRSLLLVGGNISMDGGRLNAFGGRVELGGLSSAGTVGLNGDGNNLSLSFPDSVERSDIFLSNGAQVNVTASDGGSIALNARNLEMTGESYLLAGIDFGLGSDNSQAGNIAVNATGAITLNNESAIGNLVLPEANGQGGDVSIRASTLRLEGGAQVFAATFGAGNGGDLSIDAQDVQIIGTSPDGQFLSSLAASTDRGSTGDAGDLTIKTNTMLVRDGGQVSAATFGAGKGGALSVDAQDVQIIGTSPDGQYASGLFAAATQNSTGDAGDLMIKTNTLRIEDGAQVSTTTFGAGKGGALSVDAQDVQLIGTSADGIGSGLFATAEEDATGNAGDVTIKTNTLLVRDGAQVSTATFGAGKGGNLSVDAQDVQLIGRSSVDNRFPSALSAGAAVPNSTGDAGNLTIKTNTLVIRDGAGVFTATQGAGNGGNLSVDAQDVQIIGTTADGRFTSFLNVSTAPGSTGDAGDVTIETNTLLVRDGAQVGAATFGAGNGGDLRIDAQDVQIIGTSPDGRASSGLFASADRGSTGDAGNLTIGTNTMLVRDGAGVTVQSLGTGTAGNMTLNARSIRLDNDASLNANTRSALVDPNREQATININSQDLIITGNSNITTNATGANVFGGNIRINTDNLVAVPTENSDISANSSDFRGGNVTVRASGIFGIEFREQLTPLSDITATGVSSEFSGTVNLITPGIDPTRGLAQLPTEVVDASDEIAQGCRDVQDSSFVVTGRGGLPPTPQQALGDDPRWRDWRTPAVVGRQPNTHDYETLPPSANPASTKSALVEATGWVIEPDGKVILTASAFNVTSPNRWGQPVNCDGS